MRSERRLLLVLPSDWHLPISRAAFEIRKQLGISQRIKAIFHSRQRIRNLLSNVFHLTIVDSESGLANLLGSDDNGACPRTMDRCSDLELQHFVDLISEDPPCKWPGSVWSGPYRLCVWRSNNGMICCTDDSESSVPHRRMGLEHVPSLHVHVLRRLTEVEVVEGVTTGVGGPGLAPFL